MATEEIVTEADKAKGRVIEERKELVEKYTKLFSFVYSDKLHTFNKEMQELLGCRYKFQNISKTGGFK